MALLLLALIGGCVSEPPVVVASQPPDSLRAAWQLAEPATPGKTVLQVTVSDTCPGGWADLQAFEYEDRIELLAHRQRRDYEDAGCLAAVVHEFEVHLEDAVGERKVVPGHPASDGRPAAVSRP